MGYLVKPKEVTASLCKCAPPTFDHVDSREDRINKTPDAPEGSVWECDRCKTLWIVGQNFMEGNLTWHRQNKFCEFFVRTAIKIGVRRR